MKRKNQTTFRGFIKKNGFYIAMVMFVVAGAIASYTAVMSIIDAPAVPKSPDASLVQNQPQQPVIIPEPVAPQQPTEHSAYEDVMTTIPEPLTPVFHRAVSGSIMNPFSGNELVKSVTMNDWRTHNGTDYGANVGDAVSAIFSGEVTRVEKNALWGNIIEIKLDSGHHVLYANLQSTDATTVGQRISQGDIIGAVGNTALVENGELPHLHMEVKSGTKYIDPESLF